MTKLEVGRWDKLPHYAVIGKPTEMYLWVNEDGIGSASNWIKGKESFELYHELRQMVKDKSKFIQAIKMARHANRRKP